MKKTRKNSTSLEIYILPIICLLLILHPIQSIASSPPNDDNTAQATTATAKISMQDYRTMAEFTALYDQCLQHTSQSNLDHYNDPRHILDNAMKKCAPKLDALNAWLIAEEFSLNFRKHYIKRATRKSVSQTMPKIMLQMANQHQ